MASLTILTRISSSSTIVFTSHYNFSFNSNAIEAIISSSSSSFSFFVDPSASHFKNIKLEKWGREIKKTKVEILNLKTQYESIRNREQVFYNSVKPIKENIIFLFKIKYKTQTLEALKSLEKKMEIGLAIKSS